MKNLGPLMTTHLREIAHKNINNKNINEELKNRVNHYNYFERKRKD